MLNMIKYLLLFTLLWPSLALASKPVFYSVSPVGTSTDMKTGSPTITISSGVATLSVAQTGNIGAGCRINYNSTHCFIAPNRIGFDSGSTEIKIGDKISGGTSSATGIVRAVHLTGSGTWAGGDATGYIYFEKITGAWQDNETINRTKPSSSSDMATTDGTVEGNIGNGDTKFVVLTATGGEPTDVSTAVSVTNIYHEYSSIYNWELGFTDANHINNASLVTAEVAAFACCYYDNVDNDPDTSSHVPVDATTDSDNFIYIYTPTGGSESINNQRHEGKASTTKYYLSQSDYAYTISARTHTLTIDGIYFIDSYSDGGYIIQTYGDATNTVIKNCILNIPENYNINGIDIYSASSTAYIYNCIIYNSSSEQAGSSEGVYLSNGVAIYLYNSIVQNFNDGTERDTGTFNIINCAVFDNADDFDSISSITYTASDDTETGTGNVNPSNWNNVFIDYQNGDFSLKSTDTDLKDSGSDLFSDTYIQFWRGIDGTERGGSWDIGADEYEATSNSDWPHTIYGISPSSVDGLDLSGIGAIDGLE